MLSITVDPALTFNLIRVLAALTCIAISGFLLVYFAFGLRSLTAAVATALPIGLTATLLVANLFAYVIGTPRALTWGLLAVLAVAITIALARRHYYKPLQPLSRLDGGLFFGAAVLLFILSAVNYAVYPVWDYYLHFWLANTIRFGNFPVMAPGAPMLVAEYHYGGAFIAAILSHIGQLDSAISFFILTPFAAMTAYLTASVLAATVLKNIRFGLLAGLFFSFGAGLTFLIAPVRNIHLRWFAPATTAAEEILVDSLASITPTGFAAFPLYLTQPHYLIAWAVLLSVIILATHFSSPARHMEAPFIRRIQWIMLGVLFASVALFESSVFVLGLVGWGAYALWGAVSKRKTAYIGSYLLAATPAALIAVFQGVPYGCSSTLPRRWHRPWHRIRFHFLALTFSIWPTTPSVGLSATLGNHLPCNVRSSTPRSASPPHLGTTFQTLNSSRLVGRNRLSRHALPTFRRLPLLKHLAALD